MNTLVIYDSVFGNTEKIARAIGETIGSQENVATLPVSQVSAAKLRGLGVLIVGSPTRGFRPTEALAKFLNALSKNHLAGVRVATFDTRWALESIDSGFTRFIVAKGGYAASSIAKSLEKKGAQLIAPPEGFFVTGIEGPLQDGELERAVDWAKHLIAMRQPIVYKG